MLLSLALHKPKGPEEEGNFLESLKEYGDLQRKYEGHLLYSVGKDEKTGVLTVLSLLNSQKAMMDAGEEMKKFRQTFDFRANQLGPTRYFQGTAEFVETPIK